jgi:septum formation protein
MRILLASTSRYRRELVQRLRVPIECLAPPYDEEADKAAHAHLPIPELAMHLAKGKAASLAALHPDALVIGSDQMGELDGARLGKPHTFEAACAQLGRMAGRTHRLHTAVAVHHGASGRVEAALDTHTLAMRALTADEIERYVRADDPVDCAGSYRVESLGVALFERITGDDFTAVIGLPLTKTVTLLGRFGQSVL